MSERLAPPMEVRIQSPPPEAIAQFVMSGTMLRQRAKLGMNEELVRYAYEVIMNDIYVQQVMGHLGLSMEQLMSMDESLWRLIANELTYGE